MRRRLDLAGALLGTPEVLFLDEPTTGLDPRSRMDMWGVIDELVKGGVTLLLTTQYLEEADQLADSIAVVDHGRVIARGTSDELKKQVGGETLSLIVEHADDVAVARDVVAPLALAPPAVEPHLRRITAPVSGGAGALVEAVRSLDARGVRLLDVGLHRPTLDDVFLTLTGRPAEDESTDAKGQR
jgi:ABC-2 type transport system ATP-binding protein